MKLYIIAGEASGDLHGSNLVKALRQQHADLVLRGWGGDLMKDAQVDVVKHYRDLAFMGFIEVILNIRTIARNLSFCKQDIESFKPDALILIDYPGFNLRIAEWAKQKGIRVFYYISPQIWAWKENRIHAIKRSVERMFVVLPFEKAFYAKHGYDVTFAGHPLLDVIERRTKDLPQFVATHGLSGKPVIALLPGSRKQEISTMLPLMLSVCNDFPEYEFVVAGAPGQSPRFYEPFITGHSIKVIFGYTYDLLQNAEAGLITSGTATLEAGLFRLPQVVCYKGSSISYQIAKRLISIKYISLVNLILDRPAVTELIQAELNRGNIYRELNKLLHDPDRRTKMVSDYDELHEKTGGPGASERVAKEMLKILES